MQLDINTYFQQKSVPILGQNKSTSKAEKLLLYSMIIKSMICLASLHISNKSVVNN